VRTRKSSPQGLKSLRENWALQLQPRGGDLKVAQDAVLGWVYREKTSPAGTAESTLTRFSRPSGTNDGWDRVPRTGVLGYFQVAPTGLELQSLVLTQTLKPDVFSTLYDPTKVVP